MEAFWAALVLLLGAAVANPVPHVPLSYEQVLASAVKTHNQESALRNAFRLLAAEPQPGWLSRNCSGFYSTAKSPPSMVVQCEDVDQQLHRRTRGRFKKWKKKLRKAAKILRMAVTILAR